MSNAGCVVHLVPRRVGYVVGGFNLIFMSMASVLSAQVWSAQAVLVLSLYGML